MTIKEWVKSYISDILEQIRPCDGNDTSWLDILIEREDEVVQGIIYRYDNDANWDSINRDDKNRIASKILDEIIDDLKDDE